MKSDLQFDIENLEKLERQQTTATTPRKTTGSRFSTRMNRITGIEGKQDGATSESDPLDMQKQINSELTNGSSTGDERRARF